MMLESADVCDIVFDKANHELEVVSKHKFPIAKSSIRIVGAVTVIFFGSEDYPNHDDSSQSSTRENQSSDCPNRLPADTESNISKATRNVDFVDATSENIKYWKSIPTSLSMLPAPGCLPRMADSCWSATRKTQRDTATVSTAPFCEISRVPETVLSEKERKIHSSERKEDREECAPLDSHLPRKSHGKGLLSHATANATNDEVHITCNDAVNSDSIDKGSSQNDIPVHLFIKEEPNSPIEECMVVSVNRMENTAGFEKNGSNFMDTESSGDCQHGEKEFIHFPSTAACNSDQTVLGQDQMQVKEEDFVVVCSRGDEEMVKIKSSKTEFIPGTEQDNSSDETMESILHGDVENTDCISPLGSVPAAGVEHCEPICQKNVEFNPTASKNPSYVPAKLSASRRISQSARTFSQTKKANCAMCFREIKNTREFNFHVFAHKALTGNQNICPICLRNFSRTLGLYRHASAHVATDLYTCPVCDIQIVRLDSFKRHFNKRHPGQQPQLRRYLVNYNQSKIHKKSVQNKTLNLQARSTTDAVRMTSRISAPIITIPKTVSTSSISPEVNMAQANIRPVSLNTFQRQHGRQEESCQKARSKVITTLGVTTEKNRTSQAQFIEHVFGINEPNRETCENKVVMNVPATKDEALPVSLDVIHNSRKRGKRSNNKVSTCAYCWEKLNDLADFMWHVNAHKSVAGSQHTCPVCLVNFRDKMRLKRHACKHVQTSLHTCPLCHIQIPRFDSFQRHIRKMHPAESTHLNKLLTYIKESAKTQKRQQDELFPLLQQPANPLSMTPDIDAAGSTMTSITQTQTIPLSHSVVKDISPDQDQNGCPSGYTPETYYDPVNGRLVTRLLGTYERSSQNFTDGSQSLSPDLDTSTLLHTSSDNSQVQTGDISVSSEPNLRHLLAKGTQQMASFKEESILDSSNHETTLQDGEETYAPGKMGFFSKDVNSGPTWAVGSEQQATAFEMTDVYHCEKQSAANSNFLNSMHATAQPSDDCDRTFGSGASFHLDGDSNLDGVDSCDTQDNNSSFDMDHTRSARRELPSRDTPSHENRFNQVTGDTHPSSSFRSHSPERSSLHTRRQTGSAAKKKNSQKISICAFCSEVIGTSEDFMKHAENHHSESSDPKYVCPVCLFSFSRKLGIVRHASKHVETEDFVCPVCSQHYCRQDTMMRHFKKHHDHLLERDIFFTEKGQLRRMLSISSAGDEKSGGGPADWATSPNYGYTDTTVMDHQDQYNGTDQNSSVPSSLQGSDTIDLTDDMKYSCGVCAAEFENPEHLERHVHTHTEME